MMHPSASFIVDRRRTTAVRRRAVFPMPTTTGAPRVVAMSGAGGASSGQVKGDAPVPVPGGAAELMKTLMSGTAGGVAQVLAGHPFDTVKTKLQIQTSANARYSGMIDCFRQVVQEEGMRGLYRGAMSPLVGAMAHNANVFFSFGWAKQAVGAMYGVDKLSVGQTALAGALAGVSICVVEVPVDLFKIKLQGQGAHGEYTGSFDAAHKIFKRYGVRGVYQGTAATVLRNIPAFGAYFGCFELMRRTLTPEGQKPTLMSSFAGGSAAGLGFWAMVYPLEMVKTRMQADASDVAKRQYKSVMDCIKQCLAKEGIQGMFKGFVPCITRAVPVNGAIFLAVSYVKSLISDEAL